MNISEQVKELRELSDGIEEDEIGRYYGLCLKVALDEAADTIEALSAKLAAANEELERWHTDKVNEKIKNPFAWTSTLCCHNCDHKDEYIEELEASDTERSAEDCGGGWIPCREKLPEESGYYLCTVFCKDGRVLVKTIYFNHLHIWIEDCTDVIYPDAWQPLPEPYHEP